MTSIPIGSDQPADRAEARQARLAGAVAGIRRRSGGMDVERALHWAGSILFPTGLIVILLGWYGAAHTSYAFEQTPYIISGGILGAALTIVGGFLYFGYWIARLVQEGRRERVEVVALLTRLDNRLAVLEGLATASGSGAGVAGNGSVRLVATTTGSLVHRPDCSLVAGRSGLRSVDPTQPGLKACRVCEPFGSEDESRGASEPVSGART
ncbi:MAG TPA: hypothetical protein VGI06_01730 [Acidimicrobiales bacterium]